MKVRSKLLPAHLRRFLYPAIIGQTPLTSLAIPPNIEVDGVMVPAGALLSAINQGLLASINEPPGSQFTTSAAASITLTTLYGSFIKLTNGGAVTVTLDYAYNIVSNILNPYVGDVFVFEIGTTASTTVATPTLSDTAVTLAGVTTVTTGGWRRYQGAITQLSTTVGMPVSTGTTFTSIAQVGSTNAFTVTLGTNTLVPTVGQAIFINVTTGTLPSGWYPIVKVTSATSFVIATPPGTVWTATAGTVPGTTTIPSSAYTTGLPGLYSPLVTITGLMGMAAGVMVT